MAEKTWSVYRHTFPDGKVYIGITCNEPEERWGLNGINYQSQQKMLSAIMKFGWDNIAHEVLYSGLTEKGASAKERELIQETDKKGGCGNYNVAYAKHEPVPGKIKKGDNAIITEETLRLNGAHLMHLPDIFYDRINQRFEAMPITVYLKENEAVIELWKTVQGGYESSKITAEYPEKQMTFGMARDWLIECKFECKTHEKIFISEQTLANEINKFKAITA